MESDRNVREPGVGSDELMKDEAFIRGDALMGSPKSADKWDPAAGGFCCLSCMYYSPKTPQIGRCRRHSPSMQGYPPTYPADDWCGDHKVGTNPHKAGAI